MHHPGGRFATLTRRRTISTEHPAFIATDADTLPRKNRSIPRTPVAPTKMQFAFAPSHDSAASISPYFGSPALTSVVTVVSEQRSRRNSAASSAIRAADWPEPVAGTESNGSLPQMIPGSQPEVTVGALASNVATSIRVPAGQLREATASTAARESGDPSTPMISRGTETSDDGATDVRQMRTEHRTCRTTCCAMLPSTRRLIAP